MTGTVDELVDLYAPGDLSGRVTGTAPRSEVRARNLPHAGTAVLVRNSAGQVYVHRRPQSKDVFPGAHDVFAGGVVSAGEDVDAAARRELAEELGVLGAELRPLLRTWYADDVTSYLACVYEARWDGPVAHQPEEVVSGEWMSVDELRRRLRDPDWPFTPDGRAGVAELDRRGLLDGAPSQPHGRRTAVLAAAVDVALVVAFAAIGRRNHVEVLTPEEVAGTAWPFLTGTAGGWLAARAWRAPLAPLRSGVPVVAGTVAGGMLLRATVGDGTAPSFVLVSSLLLGAGLVGWRGAVSLARWVRRRS